MILAIDPGPEQSAWVEYEDGLLWGFGLESNPTVLYRIRTTDADLLAVESIASYGMAVGADVFETCVWSGRFIQRWQDLGHGGDRDERHVRCVYRREVKAHLCHSAKATDANVRQALIDRYGPGKAKAIGRKASPGPLYGVSKDVWQALGVAVTVADNEDAAPGQYPGAASVTAKSRRATSP